MPDQITIVGEADFIQVSRALRAAGQGEMRKAMFTELRTIAKPVHADLRRSIETLGTRAKRDAWRRKGNVSAERARKRLGSDTSKWTDRKMKNALRGSGLRATISRGLTIKVKDSGYAGQSGIYIKTRGEVLPADQKRLPRYLDDPRGWRHPFMGNRQQWVHQYASRSGWFTNTARDALPVARKKMQDTIAKYAESLARKANG